MSLLRKLHAMLPAKKPQDFNPLSEIFADIPRLETDRLILRKITPEDANDIYDYSSRSEVTRYLLWEPHQNRARTFEYLHCILEKYKAGEFYDWAIEYREDHRMIGTCGFTSFDLENNHAEVGYVLHPQYWGKGIAPEALDRILSFGFDRLRLHRIEARYLIGNDRSRRVLEKCGMSREGVRRQDIFLRGTYCDVGVCSILHDEYQIKRAIDLSGGSAAVVLPSVSPSGSLIP